MIFIDANIPMYLVGSDHPCKPRAIALLDKLASENERLVTNVEVFQEILHRYTFIHRKDFIQKCFDTLYSISDKVYPIEEQDVHKAKDLVLAYDQLSARDALHAAQMKRLKIETIFSFDSGFDCLPGLHRIPKSLTSITA